MATKEFTFEVSGSVTAGYVKFFDPDSDKYFDFNTTTWETTPSVATLGTAKISGLSGTNIAVFSVSYNLNTLWNAYKATQPLADDYEPLKMIYQFWDSTAALPQVTDQILIHNDLEVVSVAHGTIDVADSVSTAGLHGIAQANWSNTYAASRTTTGGTMGTVTGVVTLSTASRNAIAQAAWDNAIVASRVVTGGTTSTVVASTTVSSIEAAALTQIVVAILDHSLTDGAHDTADTVGGLLTMNVANMTTTLTSQVYTSPYTGTPTIATYTLSGSGTSTATRTKA